MCILYRVFYIVPYAYSVHFTYVVCIIPILLLGCHNYNERMSCFVLCVGDRSVRSVVRSDRLSSGCGNGSVRRDQRHC